MVVILEGGLTQNSCFFGRCGVMKSSKSLSKLSNKELLSRVEKLGVEERKTTSEVIRYLIEIEKRQLYLSSGYSSLYDFCRRHLCYSESASMRRIRAARCVRAYPAAYDLLLDGEVSLDTLARVSKMVNGKNAKGLIDAIRGKSSRDVEAIVSRHSPKEKPRDLVRTIFVRAQRSGREFTAGADGKKVTTKKTLMDMLEEDRDGDLPRVDIKRKFKLEFAVNPEFMQKIERLRALVSNKYKKKPDFETLFELVIDYYLDRHSAEGRIKRRAEKKTRTAGRTEAKKSKGSAEKIRQVNKPLRSSRPENKIISNSKQSRYIPQAVRDKVYMRDGGRCTFVGTNGKRCPEDQYLQIDHIVPYARGGKNTAENLRLLCPSHNMLLAEHAYGKNHMNQFRQRE